MSNRWLGMLAILAVTGSLLLSGIAKCQDQQPRTANASDLAMSIRLYPENGAITAHEPVIVRVALRNASNEEVAFMSNHLSTRLQIYGESGKLLVSTPEPRPMADCLAGVKFIKPGENIYSFLIVSGLYDFRDPGKYIVVIGFLVPCGSSEVLAEGEARVQVDKWMGPRLRVRLDEIFLRLKTGTSHYSDLSMSTRTKALYSVRHDMALTYLEWMVDQWDDTQAIHAIRRIGSEASTALLKKLAARKGKVGEAARKALKTPIPKGGSTWDVVAD